MSEVVSLAGCRRRVHATPPGPGEKTGQIFFNRTELNQILSLYSRGVIAGDLRDYALEIAWDGASFAVYGHASERPLFRIVKRPAGGRGAVGYLVTAGGRVLRYGESLENVLKAVKPARLRLV